MADYQQAHITANGIKIHYYRSTPPHPRYTVVLLHGITDNGMCWVRVADVLSEQYDVIMLDSRGHGLSEAPAGDDYTSETHAADVAAVIEALHLDHPVLFGHSMGADTAITTAALYPGLMRGVILEDPPWHADLHTRTAEEREQAVQGRRDWMASLKVKSRAALMEQAHTENPTWPEAELGPWADSKLQVSERIAETSRQDRAPWTEYVRQARCPILLITAEPERGAIVTPENAQLAAATWQSGQVVNVPGAGHCIHREQFAPVLDAVQTFLSHLE